MSKQKFSPQAVKILAVTIVCMAIMLGVSAVNKARGGERLVREYTVTQGLPRHVKYENMPSDEAQLAAAWYAQGCFTRTSRTALILNRTVRIMRKAAISGNISYTALRPCQPWNTGTGRRTMMRKPGAADTRNTRWCACNFHRNGLTRLLKERPSGGTVSLPGILQWEKRQDLRANGRYLNWE